MPEPTVDPRLLALAARLSAIKAELDRIDYQITDCDPSERRRFGAWAAAIRCTVDGLLEDIEDMAATSARPATGGPEGVDFSLAGTPLSETDFIPDPFDEDDDDEDDED